MSEAASKSWATSDYSLASVSAALIKDIVVGLIAAYFGARSALASEGTWAGWARPTADRGQTSCLARRQALVPILRWNGVGLVSLAKGTASSGSGSLR